MKHYIILSMLGLWTLNTQPLMAQKEMRSSKQETIVIDDGKSSEKTVFEIRDGKIYLDGKLIKPFESGTELKIIKKNRGGGIEKQEEVFSMEIPDMSDRDVSESKKAFLGVASAPTMENDGVIVENVTPGSPADQVNINKGDKITKVDGKKIGTPQDLVETIGAYKPGDRIAITYEQDGKEMSKDVELADKSSAAGSQRLFRGGPFNEEFSFNFPNFNFDDLFRDFRSPNNTMTPNSAGSPKIGVQAEDRADNDGVLIVEVAKGSAAEKAGIKENDVITMFGGKTISSVDDLQAAVQNSQDKKEVTLDVKRGKNIETLYMQMPKELKRKQF